MGRYKALIGPRLRARGFAAQQTEAATGVAVLNRMLATGRPKSFRCPARHRIPAKHPFQESQVRMDRSKAENRSKEPELI
jgi:hypothetical protein